MRCSKDGRATHAQRFLSIGLAVASMAISVPTFADQPSLESSAQSRPARFTVLGEYNREAVRDQTTGLVWEQSPALDMSDWEMAQRRCSSSHAGGDTDWRVPTVQELRTLVEPSSIDVKLPADHPFANVEPSIYWSSTERRENGAYASFVNFSSGRSATLEKFMPSFVWCVRGAMNETKKVGQAQ
jgi:uncharacterized protein DUF1566